MKHRILIKKWKHWGGHRCLMECLCCKKLFEITGYEYKIGRGKFCSKSCIAKESKNGFKKGHKINLGSHCLKTTKIKISKANTGNKLPPRSKEEIKKRIETRHKNGWWKNIEAHREIMKGVYKRWALKDRAVKNERNDPAYQQWRKEVYKRDNWKCKIENEDCSGRIIAHHILGWSKFPELRYKINNGITLCQAHHPRKRAEEKRLVPFLQGLVPVLSELI